MGGQLEPFLALSAILTGFREVQLSGTEVAQQHLDVLREALPAAIVDDLFTAFKRLPAGDGREKAVAATILGDPKLGPVAKNIILLWYTGMWNQMPEIWRRAHGASVRDVTHLPSGAAYRAGLQWAVAGAHPPGASHQGFASWALEPRGRA
ncbi:MAG: hypothetical protein KL863_11400 [Rhizobium sp.]|nr:hypothetical protein [Rhizobium sp.]